MRKEEPAMKMLAINPISVKKRMIEFLFDYLFILTYFSFSVYRFDAYLHHLF